MEHLNTYVVMLLSTQFSMFSRVSVVFFQESDIFSAIDDKFWDSVGYNGFHWEITQSEGKSHIFLEDDDFETYQEITDFAEK